MIRKLAFIASLAGLLGTVAACADTTAPKNDCRIINGSVYCTPD